MDSFPVFASITFVLCADFLLVLATIGGVSDVLSVIPRAVLLGMIVALSIIVLLFNRRLGYIRHLVRRLLFSALQPLEPEKNGKGSPSELHTFSSGENAVEAIALHLQDCRPTEWDIFAQQCDASFRSTHNWLQGWSIKSRFRYRLELFEFYQSGQKIGQCALGLGASERIFLDNLSLKPDSELLWSDCIEALLRYLGSGRYRYGWQLNLERAREDDLRKLQGVFIESVHPITVHAVDFCRWHSWEEYWGSTSSNVRRNVKCAEKAHLKVVLRTGLACLLHARTIVQLRSIMYRRKGIEFRSVRTLISYVGSHIIAPQHRLTAIVTAASHPLAGFSGFEFGTHTYYIDGGSRSANSGAAWYLQKSVLQRTWERSQGRAKLVMGYVDYATHDNTVSGGLLRSRRAVNASEYETSIITFLYERPHEVPSGMGRPISHRKLWMFFPD